MSKKKLLLADTDEGFLRELSYYFMERVPQFELVISLNQKKCSSTWRRTARQTWSWWMRSWPENA